MYQYSIFTNIKSIDEIDKDLSDFQKRIRYIWVFIGLGDFLKDLYYLKYYPHIHISINIAIIITILAPFAFVSCYFEVYNPKNIVI